TAAPPPHPEPGARLRPPAPAGARALRPPGRTARRAAAARRPEQPRRQTSRAGVPRSSSGRSGATGALPRRTAARTAGSAPGRAPGIDDASPALRARPPAHRRRSSDPYRTRLRARRRAGPARLSRKLAARPRPAGARAPLAPPAGEAAPQRDRAREARKPARPDAGTARARGG